MPTHRAPGGPAASEPPSAARVRRRATVVNGDGAAGSPERAEEILLQAARLFRQSGYHGVRVGQIGQAVGITGGAIYRHYKGKEQLLVAMVDRVAARLAELLETTLHRDRQPSLRLLAELTVRACLDDRDLMSAYQREMRSLPPDLRTRVREQQTKLAGVWCRAIRAEVPNLSAGEVRCRTAALVGLALTPISYRGALPEAEYQDLLVRLALAAGRARVPTMRGRRPTTAAQAAEEVTPRRERVLQEAVRLFRAHGFPAVTMEAIGAAAGIDGSSVYRHYRDKEEILATAFELAGQRLLASLDAVAVRLTDPTALDLVAAYIDEALDHRDLTAIWLTEVVHMTGPRSRAARTMQRTYIERFVSALRTARPDLDHDHAQVIVRAVFLLINGAVSVGPQPGCGQQRLRALLLSMAGECLAALPGR